MQDSIATQDAPKSMQKDLTKSIVSQLNSVGCKVKFRNIKGNINDVDAKLIGNGDQTRGNLFYLDINDATCLVVQFDNVWLWHKRLSCKI